jgi:hypothetical protein
MVFDWESLKALYLAGKWGISEVGKLVGPKDKTAVA